MIHVDVVGADAVFAALVKKSAKVPAAALNAAVRGAMMVEGYAKREGFRTRGEKTGTKRTKSGLTRFTYAALGPPVDNILTSRTGALRSSIQVTPRPEDTAALVGPSVKYGAIHEFGGTINVGARSWRGGFRKASKQRKSDRTKLGSYVRRHSIGAYTIRIPPRPYMRPAFHKHVPAIRRAMMRSLIKDLALLGK